MPFGNTIGDHTEEYWTRHFTDYLKPLIEENPKVEARRSQPLRGEIVREIIKDLIISPIVLADLTDSNPNVYWELGVRQSFKSGTITIMDASHGDKIPFDIGSKTILFYYPGNTHKDASFRINLKNAIRDCLQRPDRPDSAVLETVTGRGTLYEIVHREESTRRLDALVQELRRNEEVFKTVIEIAEKNQQLRNDNKSVEFPTERFRLSCTELLLTHRYLDEPAAFYFDVASYYSLFITINDQLNLWESRAILTESWLLNEEPRKETEKLLAKIGKLVEAEREKLLKQF
jgi:hypothetical protein